MSKLIELEKKNGIPVYDVHCDHFASYGRVLKGWNFSGLIEYMERETSIPESGNIYVPSVKELEEGKEAAAVCSAIYGGMPIEIGYCNGRNTTINGFEYHKGSEINIAVTDFLLALGHRWDISGELTYDIDKAEIFYVEKGTVIEMFQTTLHLSPIRTCDEGFKNIVILPQGTNTPLSEEDKESRKIAAVSGDNEANLLLMKNKWVISHPEREPLIKQGAHPGVLGPNREIKY